MFYLTTHSTHFIYGYMASDMLKTHSDSERGNPLPPHGLLFPISNKGSFICIIPRSLLHQSWSTGWNEKRCIMYGTSINIRNTLLLNSRFSDKSPVKIRRL